MRTELAGYRKLDAEDGESVRRSLRGRSEREKEKPKEEREMEARNGSVSKGAKTMKGVNDRES